MIEALLHLIEIALVALALTTAPAIARAVNWTLTQRLGFTYYMPPLECRIGPLPPYTVTRVSQATMDKVFLPRSKTKFQHMFGWTDYDPELSHIYVSSELPPQVSMDLLIHEQAHLRGCEHPTLN